MSGALRQGALLVLLLAAMVRPGLAAPPDHFDRLSLGELIELARERLGPELRLPALDAELSAGVLDLRDLTVEFLSGDRPSFTATGVATILDSVTSDVLVSVARIGNGSPHILVALRPERLDLADLLPGAGGGMSFPSVILTAFPTLGAATAPSVSIASQSLSEAARAFYRPVLGPGDFALALDRGVGLVGAWPLAQLPPPVVKTFGLEPSARVLLEGSLGLSLRALTTVGDGEADIQLKGLLPLPSQPPTGFPEWLTGIRPTELTLELAYARPEVLARVRAAFEAVLDGRKRRLEGSIIVALGETPIQLVMLAALKDPWRQPFGIEWLALDDVGVLLSLGAGAREAEIHGYFELGGVRLPLAMEVAGSGAGRSARLEARADRVSTSALTDLVRRHTAQQSLNLHLPAGMAELRDVELAFAAGTETSFSISGVGSLEVELDGRMREIEVATALALERGAVAAQLEGRLVGAWDRPFGLRWLRLEDVRVQFGADTGEDPLAGGTLSSSFALGGKRVGLEIALEKGATGTTARLLGSIDQLSSRELGQLIENHLGESPLDGGLPDLTLRDFRMSLEVGSRNSFSTSATTRLNGREAHLLLSAATSGGRRQILTGIKLDDWSVSDAIPAFEGSVLEELRFSTVALLLTKASGRLSSSDLSREAYEFYRAVQGTDEFTLVLEPGLSLVGAMPLAGPLRAPLATLGSASDRILVAGSLPGSVVGLGGDGRLSLRAELPPMAPKLPNGSQPPWFRSGRLGLFVEAGPGGAAAGLDGTLDVTIDGTDMSFTVGGEFGGRPVAISLFGRLATDEPWVSPFDIGWLTLRGVGVELAYDPIAVALGLGFSGDLDVGAKSLEVDVALALNVATGVPTNFVFRGASSTTFAMSDLAALQQRMVEASGKEGVLPIERLPELELRPIDAETPIELQFVLRQYEDVSPGFAMTGALFAALSPGASPEMLGEVECRIGPAGIRMYGSVPRKLTVGGVSLANPLVDLDLVTFPPAAAFVLTGDLATPWFTKRIDVQLERESGVPKAVTRAQDTVAAFRTYSKAFKADPVAATERSLTGSRGLFTVAGVAPPPWTDDLFKAIAAVRDAAQGTDPRTLLQNALTGIDVTIPAGQGLPHGGRDPFCRAPLTRYAERCWRVPPSEAEELGFTTACVSGVLEDGRCWLVPPSLTSTRPKTSRRECVARNRFGACIRYQTTQVCPRGTTESGGRCYTVPPGPPRLGAPSEPSRLCAGVVRAGRCWRAGRAPSPEGGADLACPATAPLELEGRCWSVPPTPEIQTKKIAGICKTSNISCTVDGLLSETISPLIEGAVSRLLAPFESRR